MLQEDARVRGINSTMTARRAMPPNAKQLIQDALAPFGGLSDQGQTLTVATELLQQVIVSSPGLTIEQLTARTRAAMRWLYGLRSTLNPLAREEDFFVVDLGTGGGEGADDTQTMVEGWHRQIRAKYQQRLSYTEKGQNPNDCIWRHRNPMKALTGGETSGHFWPINGERLADYCAEYVERPWMRCASLDHILIDAMLYTATLEGLPAVRELLARNVSLGIVVLPKAWDLSSAIRMQAWKSVARVAVMRTIMVTLSVLIGYGAWSNHGWWVGLLAGSGFYTLLKVNQLLAYWNERQMLSQVPKLYATMSGVCELMDKSPLSPTYLRERISAAMRDGAPWPVAVFPILDRAVRADPDVWAD